MVKRSSLDPIAEAQARVRLRYNRAKPTHSGPPAIGVLSQRLTRKALPKGAASLSRLKIQWADIAGDQLARLCEPEKLGSARGGRQLTLRVVPAAAGLVQHQSEMIRQRVSVAAGGDITQIKLVQGHLSHQKKSAKLGATKVPLSAEEYEALIESSRGITDEKLRTAIVALGKAVLTDSQS